MSKKPSRKKQKASQPKKSRPNASQAERPSKPASRKSAPEASKASVGGQAARKALAWLILSALFSAGAVMLMASAALGLAPDWFAAGGPKLPEFLAGRLPADAPVESVARLGAAWNLAMPILISWPLIVAAGLIPTKSSRRFLGFRGAAGALFAYWTPICGLTASFWIKYIRFLKVKDIPESYAWLDPTGARAVAWREAVIIHLGFERVWMATLFGMLAGWAVASFIRARPEAPSAD